MFVECDFLVASNHYRLIMINISNVKSRILKHNLNKEIELKLLKELDSKSNLLNSFKDNGASHEDYCESMYQVTQIMINSSSIFNCN